MKEILIRLLFAAFLTFAAFALSSSARGQQPHGATPAAPTPQQHSTSPQASGELAMSTPANALERYDDQTQDALVFNGQVIPDKGSLVLIDPITRVVYQLDNQSRAKPFAGRKVKVVGKLAMKSNTILIDTITHRY